MLIHEVLHNVKTINKRFFVVSKTNEESLVFYSAYSVIRYNVNSAIRHL